MFPKSTYNVAENSRHSTYFSLLPRNAARYRPPNKPRLRGIPSRTCGTCLWRDPAGLCLIVYRTVRGNKPACEHWQEAEGVTKQGSFLLKIRTRKTRTVIPERFFARFGAETFIQCCTVAIGKAEALLGKGTFDDCCEVEVKDLGATVEYERPEAGA